MSSSSPRRLTYANVASTLALVVALGGGGAAVAAGLAKNSVGSPQIKNGAVKRADLGSGAVDSGKVKDNSLTGKDIDESTLVGPMVVSGVGPNGDLTGDAAVIASVTLDAPAAGFVLVTGESTFSADDNGGWITAWLRADGVAKRSTYWEPGDVDSNYDATAMMSVVLPVTKGSHTYALAVAEPGAANPGVYYRPQVTVQWFPKGSAAVQPPPVDEGSL